MSKKKNISSTLLEIVGTRPILFNPLFAKKPSNITNAILLGQLLHWQATKGYRESEDTWFYKEVKELEEETTLSPYQQRKAIEFWSSFEIIKTELRGMPPQRWFFVDIRGVIAFVNSTSKQKIGVKDDDDRYVPRYEELEKLLNTVC